MTRLIRAEIFKLRKRSMTYILLLILIGAIVLILSITQNTALSNNNVITSTSLVPADIHFLENAITAALSVLGTIGMVLAVILIATSTGSEYSWNTIRPYLLCSESRLKMFTAKLIAAGIFIIAGMIIGVLTAVLLGVLITAIRGFSWDISFVTMSFAGHQLLTFVRTLYVILPYVMLALLFTVLGRSTAAGIGFGMGVFFLESLFTGLMQTTHGWLATIPNYLLSTNVQVINLLAQSSATIKMEINTQPPSTLHAFIVLAIYIIAFSAISFILFQKRDVKG